MTSTTNTLRAKLHLDLREAFEGSSEPLAVGVGFDGAVYAAARRSTEAPFWKSPAGVMFPKSRLEEPTDYLLMRQHGGERRTLLLRQEATMASFVQPYPGGLFLAGARCRWSPDAPEKNGLAVDWEGNELARFTLGDGIQDLRVAREGTVWVSYFDEGVFGNYGWNHPGPRPIGESGLVAFSPTGAITFAYESEAARTDSVCDAYAMNVVGDRDVWLYFYTEFPIVHIVDGAYHSWDLGVGGAHSLAVRGDRVLLFGDYKRRNLGRFVTLGTEGSPKVTGEVLVEDDRGAPLDHARAWGVGDALFLLQDHRVLVVRDW